MFRFLRICVLAGGFIVLVTTGMLDLTWPQKTTPGLLTQFLAIWMDWISTSYSVTLTLMFVSCYSTFRYGYLAGVGRNARSRQVDAEPGKDFLDVNVGL